MGAIIGTQGSVIKRLEEVSGARISIVDSSEPPTVHLFACTHEGLASCEAAVLRITGGHLKVRGLSALITAHQTSHAHAHTPQSWSAHNESQVHQRSSESVREVWLVHSITVVRRGNRVYSHTSTARFMQCSTSPDVCVSMRIPGAFLQQQNTMLPGGFEPPTPRLQSVCSTPEL